MNYDILILVNIAINVGIFSVCICRLGKMHGVLWRVKSQYVFLLVAAVAAGGSPLLFQQWPPAAFVLLAGAILYMLVMDSYQWKAGPPPESLSTRGDLHVHPELEQS